VQVSTNEPLIAMLDLTSHLARPIRVDHIDGAPSPFPSHAQDSSSLSPIAALWLHQSGTLGGPPARLKISLPLCLSLGARACMGSMNPSFERFTKTASYISANMSLESNMFCLQCRLLASRVPPNSLSSFRHSHQQRLLLWSTTCLPARDIQQ
jgi:hypothetical protein